jgi:hypothetical protein
MLEEGTRIVCRDDAGLIASTDPGYTVITYFAMHLHRHQLKGVMTSVRTKMAGVKTFQAARGWWERLYPWLYACQP